MTWTDNKTGRPVFRCTPDDIWPLPVFRAGNVVIVEKPRTDTKVVAIRRKG